MHRPHCGQDAFRGQRERPGDVGICPREGCEDCRGEERSGDRNAQGSCTGDRETHEPRMLRDEPACSNREPTGKHASQRAPAAPRQREQAGMVARQHEDVVTAPFVVDQVRASGVCDERRVHPPVGQRSRIRLRDRSVAVGSARRISHQRTEAGVLHGPDCVLVAGRGRQLIVSMNQCSRQQERAEEERGPHQGSQPRCRRGQGLPVSRRGGSRGASCAARPRPRPACRRARCAGRRCGRGPSASRPGAARGPRRAAPTGRGS